MDSVSGMLTSSPRRFSTKISTWDKSNVTTLASLLTPPTCTLSSEHALEISLRFPSINAFSRELAQPRDFSLRELTPFSYSTTTTL